MICIYFKLDNTPEYEVIQLFQQIGYIYTDETAKLLSFPFVPSLMDWIYRRVSTKNEDPSLQFINCGLEHYIRADAQASDTAHRTWHFRLQCSNGVIAIDRPGKSQFYILKPPQVAQLFQNLARTISEKVTIPVNYDNSQIFHSITFQKVKIIEEEHWETEEDDL